MSQISSSCKPNKCSQCISKDECAIFKKARQYEIMIGSLYTRDELNQQIRDFILKRENGDDILDHRITNELMLSGDELKNITHDELFIRYGKQARETR